MFAFVFVFVVVFVFGFGCGFGFNLGFITWAMCALVGVVHSARADVNSEHREREREINNIERVEQLAN